METYSLLELNEYVRRVIALNFEDPVWISCEISQARQSRGHFYVNLVQKAEHNDEVVAQSNAVVWSSKFAILKRKYGEIVHEVLRDGVEVRVQVRVDFHERYGLKLVVEDIDPSFTMGNIELRKREILESLQSRGLVDQNASLHLPLAPQRIALLSNDTAAGYADFMDHLLRNPYDYRFEVELYQVALQGQNVEADIVNALHRVGNASSHYDCVVIIRGGGSRLDLAGFDSLLISEGIAACPLPVLTGIGHEIDQSVADIVAHSSLKTPTAAADFLVDCLAQFEGEIEGLYDRIAHLVRQNIAEARSDIRRASSLISVAPRQQIAIQRQFLAEVGPQLQHLSAQRLEVLRTDLKHASNIISALEPTNVLSRGFSITRDHNGQLVTDASKLSSGDTIATQLHSGTVKSTVN